MVNKQYDLFQADQYMPSRHISIPYTQVSIVGHLKVENETYLKGLRPYFSPIFLSLGVARSLKLHLAGKHHVTFNLSIDMDTN